jgi:hypothetical protein
MCSQAASVHRFADCREQGARVPCLPSVWILVRSFRARGGVCAGIAELKGASDLGQIKYARPG